MYFHYVDVRYLNLFSKERYFAFRFLEMALNDNGYSSQSLCKNK